jgi:hypothetical protein
MDKLYTVKMTAEFFGKHENTILRWIQEGVLPASQIKRGWYITGRDVRKLLKDGRITPPPPPDTSPSSSMEEPREHERRAHHPDHAEHAEQDQRHDHVG